MAKMLEKIIQRIASDLTEEQQLAVNAKGKSIVIACPGSGKTKVVAYRLAKLLVDPKSKGQGIVALSFTNNAIDEIKQQLTSLGLELPLPDDHFLGTVDSFLYQNLCRYFGYLVMGCDSPPEIVSPDQVAIIDKFIPQAAKNISLGRRQQPKSVSLLNVDYLPNGDLDFQNLFKDIPHRFQTSYPKNLIRQAKNDCAKAGLLTYSDIVYWSYKLVSTRELAWIIGSIKSHYKYWILDEAQDTSDLRGQILSILWDSNKNDVFVVGDPDQAIYEWNKAQPDFLPNLKRQGLWQEFSLKQNWRSNQLICNATQIFRNTVLFSESVVAKNSSLLPVLPVLLTFSVNQYPLLPRALQNIWSSCTGEDDLSAKLAVVAWKNETVKKIRGGDFEKLPITKIGTQVCNAVFCYKKKEESKAYQNFERLMCQLVFERPSLGMNNEKLPREMSYGQWREWISDLFFQIISLFDDTKTINCFLKQVRTSIEGAIKKHAWMPKSNLGQKLKITSSLEGENPLSLYFAMKNSEKNDMEITTIHKVKGSSVDGILVTGGYDEVTQKSDISEWLKPPNPTTGICGEPRRIAYVAMTRPRTLLVVAVPQECGKSFIYHKDWQNRFRYMELAEILADIE